MRCDAMRCDGDVLWSVASPVLMCTWHVFVPAEQAQLDEMTASRRSQFYKKMGAIQAQKPDPKMFRHDYTVSMTCA